jgi:signal peptidase I
MADSEKNTSVIRRSKWRVVLRRLAFLVAAVGVVWVVCVIGWRAVTLRAFVVPSASMGPAVRAGDRVVADIDPSSIPRRGEIWIVHIPRMPATNRAIKRVVGLPGETIEVKAGQLWVDGRPLEEPYLSGSTPGVLLPVALGPDQYFLMGDSRAMAVDCRAWGPLSQSDLVGRVTYRFWPPQRVGGP